MPQVYSTTPFCHVHLLSPLFHAQVYSSTRLAAPWEDVIPKGLTFSVNSRVWDCTDLTSTMLVRAQGEGGV